MLRVGWFYNCDNSWMTYWMVVAGNKVIKDLNDYKKLSNLTGIILVRGV